MKKNIIMLIGNGFDAEHGIHIYFNNFVCSHIFKNNIGRNYGSYFKNDEYEKFSHKTDLWSNFEGYLSSIIIQNNIYGIYMISKISKIFYKWLNKIDTNPSDSQLVESIFSNNNISFIISLNYTKTPFKYGFSELTYNFNSIKSEWANIDYLQGKFINLHSFNLENRKIKCIFGDDSTEQISKDKFISKWREKTKYNPKSLLLDSLMSNENIDKLIIYGFSFNKTDNKINKFIKNMSNKKDIKVIAYHKGYIKKLSGSNIHYLDIDKL